MSTDQMQNQIYSTFADDEDFAELIEMFVSHLPDRVASLRDCFERADYDGLTRTAHQLKGATGSYGFEELYPLALELEMISKQATDVAKIERSLNDFVDACGRARAGTA